MGTSRSSCISDILLIMRFWKCCVSSVQNAPSPLRVFKNSWNRSCNDIWLTVWLRLGAVKHVARMRKKNGWQMIPSRIIPCPWCRIWPERRWRAQAPAYVQLWNSVRSLLRAYQKHEEVSKCFLGSQEPSNVAGELDLEAIEQHFAW